MRVNATSPGGATQACAGGRATLVTGEPSAGCQWHYRYQLPHQLPQFAITSDSLRIIRARYYR